MRPPTFRPLAVSTLCALAALIASAACTNVRPCTTCPKLEGTWAFTYRAASPSGECSGVTLPTPPPSMSITRAGSRAYTQAAGVELGGTVYDDNQFSLDGTSPGVGDGGTLTVELRGLYVDSAPDAGSGPQLRGTFTVRASRGAESCSAASDYTAVR